MAIDDRSVRFLIGKSLTLACYSVQRVARDGARYTLELQEITTMAPPTSIDEIAQRGAEATAKCTEGLASGRAGPAKRLVVDLAGGVLRIQAGPDADASWEGLELTAAPLACQPAMNNGRRAD